MWELLYIPAGIVSLVVAMMFWQRMQRWLVRAEFARAEIVRLEGPEPGHGELPANSDGKAKTFPVVRVIDADGDTHGKRLRVGLRCGRVKNRRTLDISYDPTDLDDVRLGMRLDRSLALGFGVVGIGLILLSVRGVAGLRRGPCRRSTAASRARTNGGRHANPPPHHSLFLAHLLPITPPDDQPQYYMLLEPGNERWYEDHTLWEPLAYHTLVTHDEGDVSIRVVERLYPYPATWSEDWVMSYLCYSVAGEVEVDSCFGPLTCIQVNFRHWEDGFPNENSGYYRRRSAAAGAGAPRPPERRATRLPPAQADRRWPYRADPCPAGAAGPAGPPGDSAQDP